MLQRIADAVDRGSFSIPWLRWAAASVGITDSVAAAVVAGAMGVRLALVAGGIASDMAGMPYSDVDYTVLTDAARLVAAGRSPYERATYRYTPLLAVAMLPNLLAPPAGKLLVCAVDGAIGVAGVHLLTARGVSQRAAALAAAAYLWSPLSIVASTRGSVDAIVVGVVLAMLAALARHAVDVAAVALGLAVHLKLYPVLYTLPVLCFLDSRTYLPPPLPGIAAPPVRDACVRALGTPLAAAVRVCVTCCGRNCRGAPVADALSPLRLGFAAVAGGAFMVLGAVCYALYGADFVNETYLYHARRVDTRHNFSAHFLPLYLQPGDGSGRWLAIGSSVLQLGGALFLGAIAARDLPFALLLQTAYFVAWNRVITAQYFVWYLGLLPLVLPQSPLAVHWRRPRVAGAAAALVAGWFAAEVGWNAPAYLLEVQGQAAFVPVWAASLLFHLANAAALLVLIASHTFRPWFHAGALTSVVDLGA